MATANISIIGLYVFNPEIFDKFNVPEGMDKKTAVNQILLDNAELELLYPDYDFLKEAIGIWSDASQDVWKKLYSTTKLEYNPIWNKDGTIEETETVNVERASEGDSSSLIESDSTDELEVAGFNSESLVKSEKNTVDSSTGSGTHAESSGTDDTARHYVRKEQGNIGVTSTQQLIKEEREVSQFNIYTYIADEFRKKFCLLVY